MVAILDESEFKEPRGARARIGRKVHMSDVSRLEAKAARMTIIEVNV